VAGVEISVEGSEVHVEGSEVSIKSCLFLSGSKPVGAEQGLLFLSYPNVFYKLPWFLSWLCT
jgi:hypothetical protein